MHVVQYHLHHSNVHMPVTEVLIFPDSMGCIATIRPTLMNSINRTLAFHMVALLPVQLTGSWKWDLVNVLFRVGV